MSTQRMPAVDRRQQLLNAALEVFARKGFEGATTKEIAAAAGVTEAIIFRHFPTKLALYSAVLDAYGELAELQDALAETKACMERNDDEGLFRTLARCTIQGYRKHLHYERLLLFAALEGHEEGLVWNRRFTMPIYESLRDYVRRRQDEGALAGYDAGGILAAIAGAAQYYAMMTQMFGFSIHMTDDEVIETFTQILMNGIRAGHVEKDKAI